MKQNSNSRTDKIYINGIIALLSRMVQVIIGFVVRRQFINYLGTEFLGYDAVFTNILQILNLADLGIGVAITSLLYKPLSENEYNSISALMYLYKSAYRIIGLIVFFIGVVISGFLVYIIPDAEISSWELRLLFYINLISCSANYFLAYKRIILTADQKSYIINIYDTFTFIGISVIQILVLRNVPDYQLYLLLNLIKNVVSNVIISFRADKIYGKVERFAQPEVISHYRPLIKKYVEEVFVSRVGAMVYYATDNVIISVIRGSVLAGFLSNYTLITNVLMSIVSQLLSSIQATFGNYISINHNRTAQKEMTDNYLCAHFLIGSFMMICFIFMVQPFIGFAFGERMILPFSTVLWLGVNLMLTLLIQLPSQVFIVYKLFRYDRPVIIVSAMLNIIISVILVKRMGINGALIGTFITSLIYLFSRFYIISHFVYQIEYKNYIKIILLYFAVACVSFAGTFVVVKPIIGGNLLSLFLRGLVLFVCAVIFPSAMLSGTKEYQYITNKMLPKAFSKYLRPTVLVTVALIIILASLVGGCIKNEINSPNGSKSGFRTDSYVVEKQVKTKRFHLSIDDTIQCFRYIKENNVNSIFEEPTFAWLRKLHESYGVVTTCFVFYEDKGFSLADMPDSNWKAEFEVNSDWLRFAFHTRNKNTTYKTMPIAQDYEMVMQELDRIVGKRSIDHIIRLQSYQGSYSNIKALTKMNSHPIKGLLTADDNRPNYYLDEKQRDYIYCHDVMKDDDLGIVFISTDIRAENVANCNKKILEFSTESWNNQLGVLEIFTHEWALNTDVKKTVETFCEYAMNNGYSFRFYEN